MDLFKIERFGEELVQDKSIQELQQQKFQKKIEKRKRRKEKDAEELKSSKKKKKKKTVEVEVEDQPEIVDEKVPLEDDKIVSEDEQLIENPEETNEEVQNENIQNKESEISFPILGKQQHSSRAPSKRNLPRWLAEPRVMASDLLRDNDHSDIEKVLCLSENSISNLKKMNISRLFPVQSHVVPVVLEMYKNMKPCFPRRDVCVQSPTGSGKTLSYVLPVVEILSKKIIRELQCLVILPSKDLAVQVKSTFDQCVIGTNLKVGLAAGVKSFSKEQENIIIPRPSGHHSLVDILVCSPGRLVDHLKLTPGFSLSKLKFLVIDEADRLLSDNFDDWLSLSIKSIQKSNNQKIYPLTASKFTKVIHHVQKFLFSATLTENPEKIAALDLFNPLLFLSKTSSSINDGEESQENSMKKYIVPDLLAEKMVVVEAHQKPVALIHIMLKLQYKCVLCFTNSIESTHRLYLLLKRFDGIRAAEFSSQLNETQRKGVLRDFRNEKVNLLIATDAMSRGMDIKMVDLVVNYDVPNNAKTYVHRVGRTARGGEKGEAITVLVTKEVYHFKQMHKSLGSTKPIQKVTFSKTSLSPYEEEYEEALQQLRKEVQNEKRKKSN